MRSSISRFDFWERIFTIVHTAGDKLITITGTLHLIESPDLRDWPTMPYLLPHERAILIVRKHPGMLAIPFSLLVAAITVASLVTSDVIRRSDALLAGAWGAVFLLLLYAPAATLAWYSMFFTLTGKRLITVHGSRVRKVSTLPLTDISGFILKRSLAGRVMGYGTVIVVTGQKKNRSKIKYMPYPEQIFLEISALISPQITT